MSSSDRSSSRQTETIRIKRSDFSGFLFLVHDTEGCHQIIPDHSEASDGGEAERHQHRGLFPVLNVCCLRRRDTRKWLIYCWDSRTLCSSVSSLARNSRAREDLPHVFQRGAGGCYQGYLKMKKTQGFGQGRMRSYACVERHHSTFWDDSQSRGVSCNVLILYFLSLSICTTLSSAYIWVAGKQSGVGGYFCYQSVQQLNLYSKG